MINDFNFIQAADLPEALTALCGEGKIMPLSGGTNVLVNMKRAPLDTDCVVDLTRVTEIKGIEEGKDSVRIGAGVTFAELLDWHPGGAVEGLMQPMSRLFAGPLIRNLATVGGNVCDASAAADFSPVLLALGGNIELESAADGKRELSAAEFFQGVRQTARKPSELVTAVSFEKPAADERWFYYKLGKRKADAISIVSLAMILKMDGDKVEHARIALGAVAPVALRATSAEKLLEDAKLDEARIADAAKAAVENTSPIDDFRATAAYRLQMVEVLVKRGLSEIAAQ